MSDLYLITGASGTGKSSLVPLLKKRHPDFEVYDFDDYGVPDYPTVEWRKEATRHWINIAARNASHQKRTIIAGLIVPDEIREFLYDTNLNICFCLLDVKQNERESRLKQRGATQELIDDIEEFNRFKEWLNESNFSHVTIETTNLTLSEVASRVTKWVESN